MAIFGNKVPYESFSSLFLIVKIVNFLKKNSHHMNFLKILLERE